MEKKTTAPDVSTTNPQRLYIYDHGYAWAVAFSAFLLSMMTAINIVSFGVLLSEFAEHFQLPLALLSILAAVRSGFTYLTGIIAGTLIHKYGCRSVAMFGLLFSGIGCLIGAYVQHFYLLIISFGFISGFGTGLCYIAPLVVIVKYFKEKRVLATGLSSAGFSFGSLTLGLSGGFIIQALGWRQSLVLLAGLNVQTMVAVAFFFKQVKIKPVAEIIEFVPEEKCLDAEEKIKMVDGGVDVEIKNGDTHKENFSRQCETRRCNINIVDVALLRKIEFAIFAAATLPTMTGTMAFYMLGPNRAYVQGVSKVQSSYVSSAVGSCSFVGRVTAGIMGHRQCVSPLVHYGIAALVAGVVVTVSVVAHGSLALHLMFGAMFGLCLGTYEAIAPAVIVDLLGASRLSKALGWVQGARGLCAFITLPLAGWLFDVTGGYLVPFLCMGGLQLFGGLLVLSIKLIKKNHKSSY